MNPDKTYTLYFNNQWLEAGQIDHAFLDDTMHFSNGVSEELRSYEFHGEAHIFKAFQHFQRLIQEADKRGLNISMEVHKFVGLAYDLLRRNKLNNATIHALIYPKNGKARIVLSAKSAASFDVRENLEVSSEPISDHKLETDYEGMIISSPSNPFFFIKDDVLYTPSIEKDVQPSFMRDAVIECAVALGYPVIEKSICIDELEGSDVAFFSSATEALSLVKNIDNYSFSEDWRETIAMDLFLMLRQQVTNEDFWNHSII